MRQNRSLRPSNRQKFKGDNRETIHNGIAEQAKIIFKEFPKEQVDQVVNQIKQDFKTKRRREIAFLISFFSIAGVLIIYTIISSTNYSKKAQIKNTYKYNSMPSIIWSGKRSDPLNVPFSNLFYSPFIGNMDFEVEIDKSYTLYNNNMVVDNTTNILFYDNECNFTGKLLPKNGYISWMYVGPKKKDLEPKKIIYSLTNEDTNNDGLIDEKDHHYLFISNLDGKDLTKITNRQVHNIEWIGTGDELLMKFSSTESENDSLFGIFNTNTKELTLTNQKKKQ